MCFGVSIYHKVQLWKESNSDFKSGQSEHKSVAITLLFSFCSGVTNSLFLNQIGPCLSQSSSTETLHEDFQFEHGISAFT